MSPAEILLGPPYITHQTLETQVEEGKIDVLPNGLFDLAILFGSVHALANWRENPEFYNELKKYADKIFTPRVPPENWGESNAEREAWIMHRANIIVFRLENRNAQDVSLGSMAEVGMAVTSAILHGQQLIISIEDDLDQSFTDIGSRAEFAALLSFIEDLVASENHNSHITVHHGNDLSELARLVKKEFDAAHTTQKDDHGEKIAQYELKTTNRMEKNALSVIMAGSSGPYAQTATEFFKKRTAIVQALHSPPKFTCVDPGTGIPAAKWEKAWSTPEINDQLRQLLLMFKYELGLKKGADILVIPVLAEAVSKAAVAEIGFLIAHALQTGQPIMILIEPFDINSYLVAKISDLIREIPLDNTANDPVIQMRTMLRISSLEKFTAEQIEHTQTILRLIGEGKGETIDGDLIQKSLLVHSPLYWDADAIWRIRTLVSNHIKQLLSSIPEDHQNFLYFTQNFQKYIDHARKFISKRS